MGAVDFTNLVADCSGLSGFLISLVETLSEFTIGTGTTAAKVDSAKSICLGAEMLIELKPTIESIVMVLIVNRLDVHMRRDGDRGKSFMTT
jgi:hypothetical protein